MKGQPVRYVRGHDRRTGLQREMPGPNPSGLCRCGCEGRTPLAWRTAAAWNWIKGKPTSYIPGHTRPRKVPFCGCGCGQPVKRHAHRFIWGHTRIPPAYRIDSDGCWIWTGAVYDGTPDLAKDPRPRWGDQLAYRRMYEREVGPIPEGHDLHHTCEKPMCVNPRDLEPLTPADHRARHCVARAA